MHLALPYQDLTIMDACLACGVRYLDTANYEPENTDDPAWRAVYEKRRREAGFSAYFDYSWQWAYREKFREKGITALLGCGFDPGVSGVFCAYARKHHFDTIEEIDILDCNGGDHGYPFATNFNPEINLREVSAPGSYWENGRWIETGPMEIKRTYDFDGVGKRDMYLLHHEEIESLAKNIPGVRRIRFFMTFSQSYLTHISACRTSACSHHARPVRGAGDRAHPVSESAPPDPASLGPRTKGKTNIGCILRGRKDGRSAAITSTTSATMSLLPRGRLRKPSPTRPACRRWSAPSSCLWVSGRAPVSSMWRNSIRIPLWPSSPRRDCPGLRTSRRCR